MLFTFMVSRSKYVTQNLSTMNQRRLNHTMMLYVYKEMLDDLELKYSVAIYTVGCKKS